MATILLFLLSAVVLSSDSVLSQQQLLSVRSHAQLRKIYASNYDWDQVVDKDLRNVSSYVATVSDYSEQKLPERVLHGAGTGARGYFQVTHDITNLSHACVFQSQGKNISVLARFSMAGPHRNKPDSDQDARGLAVRFFTDCGNWDVVSNTLVFFFRDAVSFAPDYLHALVSGDSAKVWDLRASHPESAHRVVKQFSYLGTPSTYRHIDTSAAHTFKLVSSSGTETYARFHFISEQGARYNNISIASQLSKANPKHAHDDLRDSIARGEFPSWKLMIQTMPVDNNVTFDPFDSTHLWPREDFPYQPVGRIVLTENVKDNTQEVEAVAFNPGNLIPGIEPSKDPLFAYRVFAYYQMQRNRLGPDFRQLYPVNAPARDFSKLKMPTIDENVLTDGTSGPECTLRQLSKWYQGRAEEEQKQIAQLATVGLAGIPAEVKERLVAATYDKVDPTLGSAVRNARVGAHAKG